MDAIARRKQPYSAPCIIASRSLIESERAELQRLGLPSFASRLAATGMRLAAWPVDLGALVRTFRELFVGRNDAYLDETHGCVKARLTNEIIEEHLRGRRRIGAYSLIPHERDARAKFLVLDFDGKNLSGGRVEALRQANAAAAVLEELSLAAYLEESRSGKGFHVWAFFGSNAVSLLDTQELGRLVLRLAELPVSTEVFPKGVATDPFGGTPYAPLHGLLAPRGGSNTMFVRPDGAPQEDQVGFLREVQCVTAAQVEAAIQLAEDQLDTMSGSRAAMPPNGARVDTAQVLQGVPEGERDNALFRLACKLRRADVPQGVTTQLVSEAAAACTPPFPIATAVKKVERAYTHYPAGTGDSTDYQPGPAPSRKPRASESEIRALRALDLAAEPAPVPWIVEDWLAAGDYHALGGLGKVGKSLVALHTGVVLASGRGPWLGRIALEGGSRRVLYVDEEQAAALVLRRLHKLARGLGIAPGAVRDLPLRYLLRNGLNLEDAGDLQSLFRAVEEFKPNLVILDTIVRLHRSNENEVAPMRDLYATAIRPLLDHYGCTVLGLAHLNKPVREGKRAGPLDLNRVRGSSELVNAADSIWGMERRPGHPAGLHLLGGRHGDAEPLAVYLEDTPDGGLLLRGKPMVPDEAEKLLPNAEKILAFLRGRGDPAPVHEIASQVGLHRNTVSKHLATSLAPRGLVEPVAGEPYPGWRALYGREGDCTTVHTEELCTDDAE